MKKLLALLLALAMVLSLAACADTQEGPAYDGTGEPPVIASDPAPEAGKTDDTTAEVEESKDYSGYTIRIYSNSNSAERVTWLINEAKDAGFTISIDDQTVISGDTAAIQAANENKDGDLIVKPKLVITGYAEEI